VQVANPLFYLVEQANGLQNRLTLTLSKALQNECIQQRQFYFAGFAAYITLGIANIRLSRTTVNEEELN
jgi:hypothetical protein